MSSFEKYRIHEVAKDFNTSSKVISEILTEYVAAPKNHMQVLENDELDIIFEYLTQHNQMESIAEVYAPAPEEKKTQKKEEKAADQSETPAAAKPEEKKVEPWKFYISKFSWKFIS